MGVLTGLKPERVFYYFEEISKIPHGSYNVKGISDYIYGVAKDLGLEARQDDELNVVIKKPASEGYEDAPVVMLQGHMDMVAVCDEGTGIDMVTDPLKLVVKDGYVSAEGTTLGGDDGIAVAMSLAILEDDTIPHPALEVVITTEEEVGMEGAMGLDTSDLKASVLINLDSENEGHFLAGCAGGVKARSTFEAELDEAFGTKIFVKISGLRGGHSGDEIDKCRANANILLGRLLFELHQEVELGVCYIEGGVADNAIPVSSEAGLLVNPDDIFTVEEIISRFEADVANEFRTSDPMITIDKEVQDLAEAKIFSAGMLEKVIFMLVNAPQGIQTMSAELPGLVESSLNLGILDTDAEGVHMCWAVRSSVKSLKVLMKNKLQYMTEFLGGEIKFTGEYPEWPFNPNSAICALSCREFEKLFGRKAEISTIHAGLECGLLAEKMPGLDIVSMGPEMHDIHTTSETLGIASVERTYELVLNILKETKSL